MTMEEALLNKARLASRVSLVQQEAPDFTAAAVMPNNEIKQLNLKEYLKGKMGVLFFYPLDFTFVCPTELISLNNHLDSFSALRAKVIGVSVDSEHTHLAWKNTPIDKGGIGDIQYALISDLNKSISKNYGVLINDSISLRGTFIIDTDFKIRHVSINDLPLGRNINEILRIIEAINYTNKHGEVCQANWKSGDEGFRPTREGVSDFLASNAGEI